MQNFLNVYGILIVSMTLQALLALSLYLPLMTGQLSLASAGFYALGGYIAAIMSTKVFPVTPPTEVFPLPYLLIEMVMAAVASGVLAILIGVPTLRLRGIYLALATIAFVEVVRVVSLNLPITGQAIGISSVPQPFQRIGYLWVTLPLLIFSTWFVYRLERSRVGRAFAALREDELAATAMGINPTFNKVLAFT
jgi:branched-chain amino acid transport system permease protein